MESNKPVENSNPADVSLSEGSSRRKLIKTAGTVGSGLLILANRPALAASCTISGFHSASVGTSLATYDPATCNGWSPGNWKNDNGQITDAAWDLTGINRSDAFNSYFTTSRFQYSAIRRLVNGVADVDIINYTSIFDGYTMQQVIKGSLSGANELKNISKHAAASLLNALYLAAGGGGSNPEPWMVNYISAEDVIGLYLLYELHFHSTTPLLPGESYRLERNGVPVIQSDGMASSDFADYFVSIADGPT